jgi:hypothetical protein
VAENRLPKQTVNGFRIYPSSKGTPWKH